MVHVMKIFIQLEGVLALHTGESQGPIGCSNRSELERMVELLSHKVHIFIGSWRPSGEVFTWLESNGIDICNRYLHVVQVDTGGMCDGYIVSSAVTFDHFDSQGKFRSERMKS